jgi:hypothetical protein
MEYVAGGNLATIGQAGPLPPRQAAALVEQLARAMQVAHEAGIVHRDLKPSNILLGERGVSTPSSFPTGDARPPLAACMPKITDFGLAKKLDEQSRTQTGAILGTPCYMAPEQARAEKALTPAVDIYALGAILYECLTGRPPFRAATTFDTVLQVIENEPVPPTQLNAKVPRDLETICLCCLRKEPSRRYATAAALGEDLARFLAGEPILARPVGRGERVLKWARRKPGLAALSGALIILAIVSFATITSALFVAQANERAARASQEALEATVEELKAARNRERMAREEAQDTAYRSDVALAYQLWKNNDIRQARLAIQRCPVALRHWEWRHLAWLTRDDPVNTGKDEGVGVAVTVSPNGKH